MKEMTLDYVPNLVIRFDSDRETFPNGQRDLVEISRFLSDIGPNSPIVILLVLFRASGSSSSM
jgi:hypothetical protein